MSAAIAALQQGLADLQARESAIEARSAQAQEERARQRDAVRAMEDEARGRLQTERAQLERERADFQKISGQVEEQVRSGEHVVKLNIGGTHYETTRSTLARSRYFEALLSGRYADPASAEGGRVFVDRDGALFAPILAFLRGSRCLRLGALDRGEVLEEARFYCIDEPGGEEPFREALGGSTCGARRAGCELGRADIVRALLSGGGKNLRGLSLRGIDLSYLDLSNADLRGADLTGALLTKASFLNANLYGANLYGANLSGADFSNADLTLADLNQVSNANFRGAKGAVR